MLRTRTAPAVSVDGPAPATRSVCIESHTDRLCPTDSLWSDAHDEGWRAGASVKNRWSTFGGVSGSRSSLGLTPEGAWVPGRQQPPQSPVIKYRVCGPEGSSVDVPLPSR